jgi:ISXO2-like transposase domain
MKTQLTQSSVENTKANGKVNHSAEEYVRLGGFVHVNSAENYFSIFKRGVVGTFHHISEQHLHRYLAEFDFRYNNRSGLGNRGQ